MSIRIGNAEPSAIKLGNQDISAVYVGSEKAWPDAVAQDPIRLLDFDSKGDGATPVQISAIEPCSVMSLIAGKQAQFREWEGSWNEPTQSIVDLGFGLSGNDLLGIVKASVSEPAGDGGYSYSNNQDAACCLMAFEDCYFTLEFNDLIQDVAPDEILITISSNQDYPLQKISPTDGTVNQIVEENWTAGKGGGGQQWNYEINIVSNITSGSTTISNPDNMGWAVIRATRNRSLYLKHLAEKKIRDKLMSTGTQEVLDV